MPSHRISASAEIKAPATRIYQILADYGHGHPRIVSRPPFGFLEVEAGGYGAGTIIRFSMRVMGQTRIFRAAITEPEPGRVLVETDLNMGAVTTFTVDPLLDGQLARVLITTELPTRDGFLGRLERALMTRIVQPTYRRELKNLAALAEAEQTPKGR
jgi:hypothetical protein